MKTKLILQEPSLIEQIRHGIERETLRADTDGNLSLTEHPKKLGSKLTHTYITTDYSESLLEFITGVHSSTNSLMEELTKLHCYTQAHIGNEVLWPYSMPTALPTNDEIPLAYYGESNVGKLKTLYRKGLGLRYGRAMQTIAGLHYNFSLSNDFWTLLKNETNDDRPLQKIKDDYYFRMIRNFHRYKWILIYLFGASPVVHESFLEDREHSLERLNQNDFWTPKGISLRMGGLGYTSSAQSQIKLCYDELDTYIKTLEEARLTPFKDYEEIGLKNGNEYLQLNSHLLQIDNEFYSTVRPKNISRTRESALMALHYRGVEYIEVRLLDIDPFSSIGISKDRIHFLHMFLIWCLESESPAFNKTSWEESKYNFDQMVLKGRDKDLNLKKDGESILAKDYIGKVLNEISVYTNAFSSFESKYSISMDQQMRKWEDLEKIPSNQFLANYRGQNYLKSGMQLAKQYQADYRRHMSECQFDEFEKLASDTWKDQAEVEKRDRLSFDDFLKEYFDQIKIFRG